MMTGWSIVKGEVSSCKLEFEGEPIIRNSDLYDRYREGEDLLVEKIDGDVKGSYVIEDITLWKTGHKGNFIIAYPKRKFDSGDGL